MESIWGLYLLYMFWKYELTSVNESLSLEPRGDLHLCSSSSTGEHIACFPSCCSYLVPEQTKHPLLSSRLISILLSPQLCTRHWWGFLRRFLRANEHLLSLQVSTVINAITDLSLVSHLHKIITYGCALQAFNCSGEVQTICRTDRHHIWDK